MVQYTVQYIIKHVVQYIVQYRVACSSADTSREGAPEGSLLLPSCAAGDAELSLLPSRSGELSLLDSWPREASRSGSVLGKLPDPYLENSFGTARSLLAGPMGY